MVLQEHVQKGAQTVQSMPLRQGEHSSLQGALNISFDDVMLCTCKRPRETCHQRRLLIRTELGLLCYS